MALVEAVAQEFVKPVGVDISQRIELVLAIGNHACQIRIVGKVLAVVILAVSVARSLYVTDESLQFQFLGRGHHLESSSSSCGYTHIGAVVDERSTRMTTL